MLSAFKSGFSPQSHINPKIPAGLWTFSYHGRFMHGYGQFGEAQNRHMVDIVLKSQEQTNQGSTIKNMQSLNVCTIPQRFWRN
ncbi:hypothetical protein O0I10_012090 [Lichtheimia ornata]|uniref:Uncharacterized protein n=1 Tax=Lichtheimia ornata TaxID=688661 RepID=A0AAD7UTD8_9FUNG|nr:uncharacterized protein O0I10_012090 [Lichtheimia ornata]KAJ8652277.1 hypothetical protein O0I10_012090 [Lichtheimia ornata]